MQPYKLPPKHPPKENVKMGAGKAIEALAEAVAPAAAPAASHVKPLGSHESSQIQQEDNNGEHEKTVRVALWRAAREAAQEATAAARIGK